MSDFDYGETLPDGQHQHHPGYQGPVSGAIRHSYIHTVCGTLTRMPEHCAKQYALDPTFYGRTFCCGCGNYFTLDQFTWPEDGTIISQKYR